MLWLALLFAVQAPPAGEDDVLAAEVLDYRGRRDACEYTDHDAIRWRLWRCDELAWNAAALRPKLKSRPDLLGRLDAKVQDKEKILLLSSSEWHSAKVRRIIQEGTLRDGRKARVTLEANGDRLGALTLDVAGQQPLVITLAEPIEYPDIRSTRLSWYRQMIGVELNFGVEHPWCFATQDGISKLSFLIEGSRVRAVREDIVKCGLVAHDVKVTARPAARETRP